LEPETLYPSVVQRNIWNMQNRFPLVSYNMLLTFKWKYWEKKTYGRVCKYAT